jgi:hypothetical protein
MRNHVPHLDGIAAPLSFARVATRNREFSSSITSAAFMALKKAASAGFSSQTARAPFQKGWNSED